jgi:hypothetical protein
MGKRRGPDIFDDNPLTEDFLEWMVSPDGQTAGEVSGLVFATLENASVDAKRRKIIWADGERLSIEQSAERIRAEHPDRPRELIEISLCSWLDHRVPESGSERQINELDRLFGPWIRDRERKPRAAKNDREVRTLKHDYWGDFSIVAANSGGASPRLASAHAPQRAPSHRASSEKRSRQAILPSATGRTL